MTDPQPDLTTEIAVDTITNPVIYTATKDDKLLVAFSKPTIGFVLDEQGAEKLIRALQKKFKTIKRYRQGKR